MWLRKQLKKATKDDEAAFRKRMEDTPLLDRIIMVGTAFVVIVIPCLLVVTGMTFLVLWILHLL